MAQVYEYFQRACRREHPDPGGVAGDPVSDPDDNTVLFWLEATPGGRLVAAEYRCTTCVTLVSLCEHLAELLPGTTTGEAAEFSARSLLELHPGIPESKQGRASLAIEAMQSAIRKLQDGGRI